MWIHLDLGYLDGGDHSPDIKDWRMLSLEKAKLLRDNLNTAIAELEEKIKDGK